MQTSSPKQTNASQLVTGTLRSAADVQVQSAQGRGLEWPQDARNLADRVSATTGVRLDFGRW